MRKPTGIDWQRAKGRFSPVEAQYNAAKFYGWNSGNRKWVPWVRDVPATAEGLGAGGRLHQDVASFPAELNADDRVLWEEAFADGTFAPAKKTAAIEHPFRNFPVLHPLIEAAATLRQKNEV